MQPNAIPTAQPSVHPTSVLIVTVFISSASFTFDGTKVAVVLNTVTNMAGFGFSVLFPCDKMLSFASASTYSCSWTNSSRMLIHDTVSYSISVGTDIALSQTSNLLAVWDPLIPPQPFISALSNTSVSVAAPLVHIIPTIGTVVSTEINRCSKWQIDLSSTAVDGNALRPWRNVTFRVRGELLNANTTVISAEIYKQYCKSTLILIPNALLVVGERYFLEVHLCNFLGGCASKPMRTLVANSTSVPPVVEIVGPNRISMQAMDSLALTSAAYTVLCNGQRSVSGLKHSWMIGYLLPTSIRWIANVTSQSKETTKFFLSARTLSSGRSYQVLLMVVDTSSGLNFSDTVQVDVVPSSIKSILVPSSAKILLRAGDSLVLNASSSCDPDNPQKALWFNWTCATAVASGIGCVLSLSPANDGRNDFIYVSANVSTVNTTSVVRVSVGDGQDRNSSASVTVLIIEPSMPLITMLTEPAAVKYMNVDKPLSLLSTVLSTVWCNASWRAEGAFVDNNMAIANLRVPPNRITSVNWYLPSYCLLGGASYVFTVSCSSSSLSITVTTNNAPQGGIVTGQPETGYALNTSYLLHTELWSDADIPLQYSFSFWSPVDSAFLSIRRKSAISTATAILPSGDVDHGRLVNVSVVAEDILSAGSNKVFASLQVLPLPSALAIAFITDLLGSPSQNMSTDQLQNVLSVATSVLNQVPCSSAPNCSALHRNQCKSTANTCGSCLLGYMVAGNGGDENTPCIALAVLANYSTQAHNQSCSQSSSHCPSWQYCNISTNICNDLNKQCSSPTCSSHGFCQHVSSSTGQLLPSCSLLSASCDVLCICNDGFAGSDCGLTSLELAAEQAMRAQVLDGLANVIASTDSDVSTLSNAATSLYSVIRSQYDVSEQSSKQVAMVVNSILSQSSALSSPLALRIGDVLAPVNAALLSLSRLPSSNVTAAHVSNFSSAISSFQDILVKEQQPFDVVYDSFRVTSQKFDNVDTSSSVPFVVTIPLSENEKALQNAGQQLSLPTVSILPTRPSGNGSTNVFVAVVVMDQKEWKSNSTTLTSDIVTVRATNVDFVDISLAPSQLGPVAKAVNFTITCPTRIKVRKNFTCADSGYVKVVQCNGSAGSFFGVCPVLQQTCSSLNIMNGQSLSSGGGGQCVAVSSSVSSVITCRCDMAGQNGVVAAGLVMRYAGADLSRPFKSASAFNNASAVSKAYIIIVLYSGLWGWAMLIMLSFAWDWMKRSPNSASSRIDSWVKKKLYLRKVGPAHASIPSKIHESIGEDSELGNSAVLLTKQRMARYVLALFPSVFVSRSVLLTMLDEILKHHLYFNFIFRLKEARAPLVNLLKMVTAQSYLLFLLAVLYDFSYPDDDGTCEQYATEQSCLNRKYMLDSTSSYCAWTITSDETAYPCTFAEPTLSLTAGMYVSVIISFVTCISMEPLEYVMGLLAAPTYQAAASPLAVASPVSKVQSISAAAFTIDVWSTPHAERDHGATPLRHLPVEVVVAHQSRRGSLLVSEHVNSFLKLQEQRKQSVRLSINGIIGTGGAVGSAIEQLLQDIALQRSVLPNELRVEFDYSWGLDSSSGSFLVLTTKPTWFAASRTMSVQTIVEHELAAVRKTANKVLTALASSSDEERGFEILQAFVVDMLGRTTPAAKIFATKCELDFERNQEVSRTTKAAVMVGILLLNAFFIYYTDTTKKGLAWQSAYVQSWAIQLVLDIFLFETVQCLWIHVAVPFFAAKAVRRARATLLQLVEDVLNETTTHPSCLNVSEYLYVSHRLANAHPELLESALVKAYCSYLPGEAASSWLDKMRRFRKRQQALSVRMLHSIPKVFAVSYFIQLTASAPVHLQSLIIRVLEPILLSALTIAMVELVHKPVFLSVLFAALLLLLGFLLRDSYQTKPNGTAVLPTSNGSGGAAGSSDDILAPPSNVPIVAISATNLNYPHHNHNNTPYIITNHEATSLQSGNHSADDKNSSDESLPECLRSSNESSSLFSGLFSAADDSESSVAGSEVDVLLSGSSSRSDTSFMDSTEGTRPPQHVC